MKRKIYTPTLLLLASLLLLVSCGTQRRSGSSGKEGQQYHAYAVAFYNVENLFDTVDHPDNSRDNDYLPTGAYHWTQLQYERKLDNIATVLSDLALEHTPYGPGAIGVAEVENRQVLEDLVARPAVQRMGLRVIHEDGPDRRGIDVALLYNPNLFQVENYRYHVFPKLKNNPDFVTRNQLLVSGKMGGEKLHLIVGHWPSRYGGASSSYLRETAASLSRHIIDSIYQVEPNAKIIVMGDFNDDPSDKSVVEVLQGKRSRAEVEPQGLYNPGWSLFEGGVGTLAYQDKWSFFDQMLISHSLLTDDYEGLGYWKMEVFNRPYLIMQEGKRKGYPHRTFQDNAFINGYSDHFPVITYLLKRR